MVIPISNAHRRRDEDAEDGTHQVALGRAEGLQARPDDWPGPGPIDLAFQDLPHASSSVEWWYLHGHFTLEDGRGLSLFSSFFRKKAQEDELRPWRHHVAWAITTDDGRHRSRTLLDPASPADALKRIEGGDLTADDRFQRALREMVQDGRFPGPDRLLKRPGRVAEDRLSLDLDGNRLESSSPGSYVLTLEDADHDVNCELHFSALKPPQRHGIDGHVIGFTVHSMFYYFQPSCRVEGTISIDGVTHRVTDGHGWVDHEFGRHAENRTADELSFGWTWFAGQLDNGYEITSYETIDRQESNRIIDRNTILVLPDGTSETFGDFTIEPLREWTSVSTFATYAVAWRLRVPARGIDLKIEAVSPGQELVTLLSSPGFWEGRMRLSGVIDGRPVQGRGFVELSGLGHSASLDRFFGAVGNETRRQVDAFMPEVLRSQDLVRLFASERDAAWVRDVDGRRAAAILTNPLREIVLRGGKAWRSYALLACMEAVGGDPDRYRHWMVLPEILHAGSLVIDDVQDRSHVRRGGPACHVIHGEATAINVGGAAPFLSLVGVLADGLPATLRAEIYELFHQTMRASYLGQALDVTGLADMVPAAVETGDARELEAAVMATHRLKSAVPCSALARVGVRVAEGSSAQENALSELFAAYGLAFQIVDDVLNLRGFDGALKTRGEDLMEGKITAPVAKALGLLDPAARSALETALRARDEASVEAATDLLEACGALDACLAEAKAIIENAWALAEPLLVDTQAKIMLRAFGWYILERHY